MRTALAVAVVVAMTGGAVAGKTIDNPCDARVPLSAQHPVNIAHYVIDVPEAEIATDCQAPPGNHGGQKLFGCTMAPGLVSDRWTIILSASMAPRERACTLLYEQAHLPPNNWADPEMEAFFH